MNALKIEKIIRKITQRNSSLFQPDLETYHTEIIEKLTNKSVLVIGGAGTIGSSFIKAILHFRIKRLYVVDINENGLAELIRDLRSSYHLHLPDEIKMYPLNFGSKIFQKILKAKGPFEVVANFAALKHVRSEKDEYAIEAMFENNFILANQLLVTLTEHTPEHFFCVSTDKATNPVNIMGATKKLMENVIFSFQQRFPVTTARFANVAFSNGSLLDSFIHRYYKNQPIACPNNIKRFFVSPEEAGQLCLLACMIGKSGDIFFPKLLSEKDLIPLSDTLEIFLHELGLEADYCADEEEARIKAKTLTTSKNIKKYPVYISPSDTTGEKPFEEFYTEEDTIDWSLFSSIGVIKNEMKLKYQAESLIKEAKIMFDDSISKEKIIDFLERFIPEFTYQEKGKNLDQKM